MTLKDGNGGTPSRNGTWKKIQKMQLEVEEREKLEADEFRNEFKLGDVLVKVSIVEKPFLFNFDELLAPEDTETGCDISHLLEFI